MFLKTILGIAIGGALGYLYHKKVGCASGSCPITSNPYISTLYGAFIGLMLSGSF